MNPTRIAPLSAASAPPSTSIAARSESRFLPSESATMSLSRIARSDRPYGDSVTRRTSRKTAAARTSVTAAYSHW